MWLDMTREGGRLQGGQPGWAAVSRGLRRDGDQDHLKTQLKRTNCRKLLETMVESLKA